MNAMSEHCVVVIPAYNEERTIGALVDSILALVPTVIVVDDASTDRTREILQSRPVTVVDQPVNRGKACALVAGFDKAMELGATTLISMDGDAQHDAADIPRFLQMNSRFPEDVIIGARVLERQNAPGLRRFANCFADFWISWAAGQPVRDTQCGFRCFSPAVVENLPLRVTPQRGFVFESEFLIEAARHGHRITTLAIRSCYPEDRRRSHFRPARDISRITSMVAVKLLRRGLYLPGLWRSLTGTPHHFEI